jgi:protein TonB
MKRLILALGVSLFAFCGPIAAASSTYFTEPLPSIQTVSYARDARAYRLDAAKSIYEAYAPRIYRGRLPPLIHAVVVVETAVDISGRPYDVKVVRGPSHAPEVTEAVLQMINRMVLPAMANAAGFKFTEIWLVTKDGRFQLDALTEGQN